MSASIQSQPIFRYNQIALRLGGFAAIAAAIAVLFLYPHPQKFQLAGPVLLLAVHLVAFRRWVLPLATSERQLDLIVLISLCPIFALQWFAVGLMAHVETPAGGAVMCVICGLLFTSHWFFVATMYSSASVWLLIKSRHNLEGLEVDALQLLVMAPAIAAVTRSAMRRTIDSLRRSESREQRTVLELRTALHCLQQETKRRAESESMLQNSRKNESLGLMAAGVAHDFNNTLLAIGSFAEIISSTSTQEEIQRDAQMILQAVQQASAICRQMLIYSGKSDSESEHLDLCAVVREIQPLLQARVSSRVNVETDLGKGACLIRGNRSQIQQVLMNLVANGAEAIRGIGRVTVSVKRVSLDASDLRGTSAGSAIELCVSDSGTGIAPEVLEQMFDPYFTTKKDGHGFGLSIVHGICRSHGARIMVSSTPGKGTQIRIRFAELGSSLKLQNTEVDMTEITASAADSGHSTILVVDDDDLVRAPLVRMLQIQGWTVVEASSGRAAVSIARERDDLAAMILDFSMPEMNGCETLRAVRESGCKVPAILSSGYLPDAEQSATSEFAATLQKPFQGKELDSAIKRVLQRIPA